MVYKKVFEKEGIKISFSVNKRKRGKVQDVVCFPRGKRARLAWDAPTLPSPPEFYYDASCSNLIEIKEAENGRLLHKPQTQA